MDEFERRLIVNTAGAIVRCIRENVKAGQPLAEAVVQELNVQLTEPGVPVQTRAAVTRWVASTVLRSRTLNPQAAR